MEVRAGIVRSVSNGGLINVVFPDEGPDESFPLMQIVGGVAGKGDALGYQAGEDVLCLFLDKSRLFGFVLGKVQGGVATREGLTQGERYVAGDKIFLGSPSLGGAEGLVRKKDLQKSIDDLKSYVDSNIVGHTHTAPSGGGPTTGGTGGGGEVDSAQASVKVFGE